MAAKKLQGQVAIITGASRGIGQAAARRIAQAGAAVVLTARDEAMIETAAAELRSLGCQAIGVAADVADPEQIEMVFQATLDHFGRVDILVNNAAVVWPLETVADVDLDEWAYNIHVNLIGPFYMARTVLPVMLAQEYGRIINIGSGAATHPIAGASAYCASKAGLELFTRTLALELQDQPVIVAAFDPGGVNTEMQADVRSVDTDESVLDFGAFHDAYVQGKLASPEEVARFILWLAGPWNRKSGQLFKAMDAHLIEQVKLDLADG